MKSIRIWVKEIALRNSSYRKVARIKLNRLDEQTIGLCTVNPDGTTDKVLLTVNEDGSIATTENTRIEGSVVIAPALLETT